MLRSEQKYDVPETGIGSGGSGEVRSQGKISCKDACKDLVQRFPAFPCRRRSSQLSHQIRIEQEVEV